MKIGILSDTHNHIANTQRALAIFREHRVERLIHCGDVTRAEMLALFHGWTVTLVFGNMDGDAEDYGELSFAAKRFFGPDAIHLEYTAEMEGMRIAACHGHEHRRLSHYIHSGKYDYVFHGHTHLRRDERIGTTRVINPGALGGLRSQSRSVCILDLATGGAEFIDLGG